MKLKALNIIKRNKPINIRTSVSEYLEIQRKANKYTGGDISKWLRYASIKHNPNKKDLIPD